GAFPACNPRPLTESSWKRSSCFRTSNTMSYPKPPRILMASGLLAALFQCVPLHAQQAPPAAPSGPVRVNGIAAKVNGRVITDNEVNFMLAPIYAQLATQFPRRGAEFERQFKE